MDCIIPCRRVQNQQWKPAIKQAQFPGLLALIIIAIGLGNSSSYIPYGRPAGIINKHGICYMASVIQVLDAVKFALGTGSEALFKAEGGLLEGYANVHDFGSDFLQVPSCIDPDKMVKQWVNLRSCEYKRPFIIKRVKQHDGSFAEEEMFPKKVGTGAGGVVFEVFEEIFKELDNHCYDNDIVNPFAITMRGASRNSHGSNVLHRFLYKPCSDFPSDYTWGDYSSENYVSFEKTRVVSKQQIVKAPRLLTLVPTDMTAHYTPLHISFEDAKGKLGTYRLLAAAYCLPMIENEVGFRGNHAIAVVRYDNTWYKCDNHTITAFTSEKELTDWIDESARTYYEGSGMKLGATHAVTPTLIVYELE